MSFHFHFASILKKPSVPSSYSTINQDGSGFLSLRGAYSFRVSAL